MYRVSKRANALRQELGREATHAEIAEGTTLTAADVARLAGAAQATLSLDAPLAPGEGRRLQDLLADEASLAPDEQMVERALADAVAESLTSLPARESKILRLYFGLDGDGPTTLEVIGTRMGITRERVRQIKEQALSRLRQAERARSLASFFA
jgi:RNA polymerase primary sigma factor